MRSGASGAARHRRCKVVLKARSWRGVGSRNLTKKDGGLCKRRVETCNAGRAGTHLPSGALYRTRPSIVLTRIARERVPSTQASNAANEDWNLLLSFFPSDWLRLARQSGALKGLRQDKSAEDLLRVLLLHLGCGYSMRETVVRARKANLADLSDVALLKRLRKSKDWLFQLCRALFVERGLGSPAPGQR